MSFLDRHRTKLDIVFCGWMGMLLLIVTVWALAGPPTEIQYVTVPPAADCLRAPTEAEARSSYVQVKGENGEGSGTEGVWKGRVYILTARHVAVMENLMVTGDRRAVMIAEDQESDLALLWVTKPRDGKNLPSLEPVLDPQLTEDCWYTTNGAGLDGYTIKGQVAKVAHKPWARLTEELGLSCLTTLFTGQGTYGSSGGGIFVKRKNGLRLVGVVSHWSALEGAWRAPLGSPEPKAIKQFLEKAVP